MSIDVNLIVWIAYLVGFIWLISRLVRIFDKKTKASSIRDNMPTKGDIREVKIEESHALAQTLINGFICAAEAQAKFGRRTASYSAMHHSPVGVVSSIVYTEVKRALRRQGFYFVSMTDDYGEYKVSGSW